MSRIEEKRDGENAMIEMKDVMKKYSNGTTAIRNISVEIDQGEFVYVVGPSGAGKSTFIRLMYREEKATKGNLTVAGHDLMKIKNKEVPYLRREIGIVFQDYKLLPKKTVYENVPYAMQVIGRRPREIKKRVMEVLDLVGLKHKVRVFPSELSGGEQQRVSIARAIVNTPKVLIADEPTGNLDPENSWEIMKLLDRINAQGTTVVMATHNSTIVNTIRHRVIAIENGRIIREKSPAFQIKRLAERVKRLLNHVVVIFPQYIPLRPRMTDDIAPHPVTHDFHIPRRGDECLVTLAVI